MAFAYTDAGSTYIEPTAEPANWINRSSWLWLSNCLACWLGGSRGENERETGSATFATAAGSTALVTYATDAFLAALIT